MEVMNCKKCGRVFNYIVGAPICPACAKEIEGKFKEVKEYIYDHPMVSLQQLSETMQVPIPQIRKWIREERLSFAEDSPIGIECEGCGVNIKTGRFCQACKDKMSKSLSNLYKHPEPERKKKQDPGAKMRFLER